MGYNSKLALLVTFVSWSFVLNSAQACNVTCSQGKYCSVRNECLTCPPGTYQKEPIHFFVSCIPWTTKPPQSHYIIVKNGTPESDVEWRCKDGYQERQYTVGSFECIPIQTTPAPVSSTTQLPTSVSTNTTEPFTFSSHVKQHSGNDNIGGIIGGVLSLVVVIIVIIIILYRKQRLCSARPRLNDANGNAHTIVLIEPCSFTETEPLTPNPSSINYRFCLKFVEELGVHKLKSFLNVLYDPSGKFHAEKVIQFESSKTADVNTYLTKSFLTWVELNKGIYRSCIVTALADIARKYVLEVIEELVPVDYINETNRMGADVTYAGASGADDETTLSAGRKVISQDRFRLYYYLTEQIEAERLRELLQQLSDSSERFNAYNYYIARLTEERDFSNAFAQTLEEWWLRNFSLSLNNILIDFLKEQSRADVLENDEFLNRLQRIDKTSVSDRHDQEQSHSPDNLMPDDIDANKVPHNADMGQKPNVSKVEHMPNKLEGEDMSGDTESKNMSGGTESKNMSGDTESKNMSDDTESKNMSDDTESKNMSGDTTERKNVSSNSKDEDDMGKNTVSKNNEKRAPASRETKKKHKAKREQELLAAH